MEVVMMEKNNLISEYTFENFIVGTTNMFAHAVALAVASEPGKVYNPLFIYGNVGTGKTHLLHAIGNKIYLANQNSKILYLSIDKFSNEYINSIKNSLTDNFRDKYKSIDVLLIDNIQFLSGKECLQEEMFHIFNYLHYNKKQIVVACDCKPNEIPLLTERLKTRFEEGIIADIILPEYETRLAILKNNIFAKEIDDELLSLIASNSKLNIREMQGLVNTAKAYKEILNNSTIKKKIEQLIDDIIISKK
jgi:chromosomal replication initiator protein